jgi:Fe-S-cluster containining protein
MRVFTGSLDIYRMGRFLGLRHSSELFARRLLMLDEGQNGLKLPRIRFKEKPFPFCPFLINDFDEERGLRGLCSLHPDHKPLVCRLAPLNRHLDLDSEEDRLEFILPHPDCPGGKSDAILDPHREREQLAEDLERERRYYRLLSGNEDDPGFLWNFPLDRSFDELLEDWEKGLRP